MMKVNTTIDSISRAQDEVWEWKAAAFEELREKNFEETQIILRDSLNSAATVIGAKIIRASDGSYHFIRRDTEETSK